MAGQQFDGPSASEEELHGFLHEMMAKRSSARPHSLRPAAVVPASASASPDNVQVPGGDMSVPAPVVVDHKDTMSAEEQKKCQLIAAVCQNMVQKTITDAGKDAGIPAADALKNMDAWVQAYANFPFPIYDFLDAQGDKYHKQDFALTADPEVVENVCNVKGVADLKDAVLKALQKSQGEVARYKEEDREFFYFGVITIYQENAIAVRLIKFGMNLKETEVKTLCGGTAQTTLDSRYDTYRFTADKDLMIKLQAKMENQLVDVFAEQLLQFIKDFYKEAMAKWKDGLGSVFKPKP